MHSSKIIKRKQMNTPNPHKSSGKIIIRDNLAETYSDIYTSDALNSLDLMSRFNSDVKDVMKKEGWFS